MVTVTQADIAAARVAFVACSNNTDVKRTVAEGKADGGVVIQVASYALAQQREDDDDRAREAGRSADGEARYLRTLLVCACDELRYGGAIVTAAEADRIANLLQKIEAVVS